MTREIKTDGGTLRGSVDRVTRKTVWSLQCPECANLIELDKETFAGQRAIMCGVCKWKSMPVAERHPDWPDRPLYFDFTVLWERNKPEPSGLPARSELTDLVRLDRL